MTQTRADPVGPAVAADDADLRQIAWSVDSDTGTTKFEARLRATGAGGQLVAAWLDSDSDGKSDLYIRFDRTSLTMANVTVATPQSASPPCEDIAGGAAQVLTTVPVTDENDGTVSMAITFKFAPAGPKFRWAAFTDNASSKTDAYVDYVPDAADPGATGPAAGDRRTCTDGKNQGVRVDLAKAAHFPDVLPTAAFTVPAPNPVAGNPFTLHSTSADGDGTIVASDWDLGSGAFTDGSGPDFTVTRDEGPVTISLRVTDDDGLQSTSTQTITVDSADPAKQVTIDQSFLDLLSIDTPFIPGPDPRPTAPAGAVPPSIKVRLVPRKPRVGKPFLLDASGTRAGSAKVTDITWDLNGDAMFGDAWGAKAKALLAKAGPATLQVQATAADGLTSVKVISVHVAGRPALPPVARELRGLPVMRAGAGNLEHGLRGWRRAGDAFGSKPDVARSLPIESDLGSADEIGGSYARARAPLKASGRHYVTSFRPSAGVRGAPPDARGEQAIGMLTSPALAVTKRFLTLRVGGHDALAGKTDLERVEVWGARPGHAMHRIASLPAGPTDVLRQATVDLRAIRGGHAAVVAIDGSPFGHIELDAVGLSGHAPVYTPPPPIVGLADTHAHWDAHQSFGGLQGHRTYMGVPGGRYLDYLGPSGPSMFNTDMHDAGDHTAGNALARLLFTVIHGFAPSFIEGLHEQMHVTEVHRAWQGGLRLISSLAVNNQGLEHMTGSIVDRDGGPVQVDLGGLHEDGVGNVRARDNLTPDRETIEAHVAAMRQLASLNTDWMQIVYSPQEAYDVMSHGKLAVILGTEVDGLGSLGFDSPEAEVDWLWGLGIRQVTPVHAFENAIGSPVVFQDLYNSGSDLVNRPLHDSRRDYALDNIHDNGTVLNPQPGRTPLFGAFMRVEHYGCGVSVATPSGSLTPQPGECIDWRYDPHPSFFALDYNIVLGAHPWLGGVQDDRAQYSDAGGGERNQGGLTDYGRRYLEALMRRGMLIDVEHMSDHTIDGVIDAGLNGDQRGPIWDSLPAGQPGCDVGNALQWQRSMRAHCFDDAYPIMSSHTSFRGQSLPESMTLVQDFRAREFERTPRQIETIRQSGGVIAPVIGHDPIIRPPTISGSADESPQSNIVRGVDAPIFTNAGSPALNDCAQSSKSWVQAYLYGVQKMHGQGVALSDDMAVVGSTAPRFDRPGTPADMPKSCPAGYKHMDFQFSAWDLANIPDAIQREITRNRLAEEALYPQFNRAAQRNQVRYSDTPADWARGALARHRTPNGTVYDFNYDGIKTFGAIPDLLQDAVNDGVDPRDLSPLLHSAQSYVDMWNKAYSITGCEADYERCAGTAPAPLDEHAVCRNTCPLDPDRGIRLAPDNSYLFGEH